MKDCTTMTSPLQQLIVDVINKLADEIRKHRTNLKRSELN